MARPLRIQWEGAWYHITSRGNERQLIFRNDEDRSEYLGRLSQMTERYRLRLHGYTLMDNHWHGLLETLEANLSRAMQWLNSGYCGWFNRRHRRTGHLLQGRFKGIVVEPQRRGLELSRSVHLNPIRVERFELNKQSRRRNQAGLGRNLYELQTKKTKEMRGCPGFSKAIHRFQARLKEDPQLARLLAQANSQLSKCPDLTP
jgi:REP element-mobilizing transposase RayT